jgi:hypothetical protein
MCLPGIQWSHLLGHSRVQKTQLWLPPRSKR